MASATGFISDLDCYLFGAGTHYDIYQKLGAHPKTYKGKDGIYFAVWAPHAKEVHLVGDFNNWNPEASPMERISESGIWEIFNPGMKLGELYQICHYHPVRQDSLQGGSLCFQRGIPSRHSLSHSRYPRGFPWTDSTWIEKRTQADAQKLPMSIYEVHLGSWRKRDRPERDGFYTYTEAAHELAAYVKEMGYTHVELMGIAEHHLTAPGDIR